MTFQPPPPPPPQGPPGGPPPPPQGPPPGGPPQGPPPGQWGPPPGQPGRSGGFDPKSVNQLDWGIMGSGVLAFLFSFIAFYSGVDVTDGSHTVTVDGTASAWNDVVGGGFFAWFAMIFAVLGAVAVALELFRPNVKLPFPNRLSGLALFAAATLFELIALFVTPGDSSSAFGQDLDASANHGFGYWVSLIVIIAGAVLSYMRFTQTGGQLPIGPGAKGSGGPGGPGGPGLPPPPAPPR